MSRFKNASAAPEINNNPLMIISWGFAINHRRAHSFYRSTNSTRFVSIRKLAIFTGHVGRVETDGLSRSYLFLDRVHGLSGSLDTSSSGDD